MCPVSLMLTVLVVANGIGCVKNKLNDTCRNDDDCPSYAHCVDLRCSCNSGYRPSSGGMDCQTNQPQLGSLCNDSLECGINSDCMNGVCQCQQGYRNSTNNRDCVPLSCADLVCGSNAHCHEGRCFCDDGYVKNVNDNFECVAKPFPIKRGCSLLKDQCGNHARCTSGSCQCSPGYEVWINGIDCVGKTSVPLGTPCAEGWQCGVSANCFLGTCECDIGHVPMPDNHNCKYDDSNFMGLVTIVVGSIVVSSILLSLLVISLRLYVARRRAAVARSASGAAYLGPYFVATNLYRLQEAPPPYQARVPASVDTPSTQSSPINTG